MKTTRYFDEQVLRKRPYIQPEWCTQVLAPPLRHETQSDGRIRFWGRVYRGWRDSTALPQGCNTGGRRDCP